MKKFLDTAFEALAPIAFWLVMGAAFLFLALEVAGR